jgi:hypothetical protein
MVEHQKKKIENPDSNITTYRPFDILTERIKKEIIRCDLEMLTPKQRIEAFFKEIEQDIVDDISASEYKRRIDNTPKDGEGGHWETKDGEPGKRGESIWVSNNADVCELLKKHGVKGIEYKDGLPDFSPISNYECELSREDYSKTRPEHEKICNGRLKDEIAKKPELRAKFTDVQLEQIESGKTPKGYTWHHTDEPGRMQLVESGVHSRCKHLGGFAMWGR